MVCLATPLKALLDTAFGGNIDFKNEGCKFYNLLKHININIFEVFMFAEEFQ